MKNTYLIIFCLFTFGILSAQDEQLSKEEKERREKNIQAGNPFAKYDYKAKVATLSKGKYLEVHDLDSIVTIGTVRWNVNQNKIVGNIVQDTTNMYAQPIGDTAGRWLSPDPLSDEFPEWSPYTSMNDNPIFFVDPTGMASMAPIYGTNGSFLGTDAQGLQGKGIVMNESDFTQGMSHEEAMSKSLGAEGLEGSGAVNKVANHITGLADRPDYDGFVTVSEGVDWAKANPGALDNPTPDNMLYLDASKLDFGNISTSDFANGVGKSSPINLLNVGNLASSIGNGTLRATVYALGRVDMQLNNKSTRNVSIMNNSATDYDWNTGGEPLRNTLIRSERTRAGLNNSHGFKTYYYGTGTLNKPTKSSTPQFPTGPKW